MNQLIVISIIGTDRTGVVQDTTKAILACGGNVEESCMATLGAEFAVLMLVSGQWHTLSRLEKLLEQLNDSGDFTFTIRKTDVHAPRDDRLPYDV